MVSKIEIASRPMTNTSSVLKPRCTNTLSMTTWKNSGDTSANNCRKNDATSTSPRRCRYLWIAPINQVMSKRRVISDNPARRAIRISPPSQIARSSARVIKAGRDATGDCTSTLSSAALATTRNPPSRRAAMAGKGVLASRDQLVRQTRALSPRFLAQRSISVTPIFAVPNRCLICSRSAATPCKCSSITRDSSPGSACAALLVTCVSPGLDVASSVWLSQQRLLVCRRVSDRRRTVTIARRGEARCHVLAQQGGTRGVRAVTCRRGVDGIVAACRGHGGRRGGNGLPIDNESIPVIFVEVEIGDRHGAGLVFHRDHAFDVGFDRELAVRRNFNRVHLIICPEVDEELLQVGSGLSVDRDVVGPRPQVDGDLLHVGSG